MIVEGLFDFGIPTIANSNTATVSPYVFDAGSAKKLFPGDGGAPMKVVGNITPTADDNPTVRVQLVGAADAALTSYPEIIGDTGVIVYKPDGTTALASGDTVPFVIRPNRQFSAKRYYGLLVTLGGTNPDSAAGTGAASMVLDAQSMDYLKKAATP